MNEIGNSSYGPVGPVVEGSGARRPLRTVLTGRLVTLAPLNPAVHGEALYKFLQGPEAESLWCYISDGPYPDPAAFRAMLERKAGSEDPLYFAIVNNASKKPVGLAAYLRIVPAHRVMEVGSLQFSPDLQRTPAATEAMYLMAQHAFEDLGYRRYEWKCNALHERSRRAALRLGFQFEGIFRQHMIIKGRNRDTAWFAMLDSDWPARRTAFEKWLDPANFDAHGRQKLSLSALNGISSKN